MDILTPLIRPSGAGLIAAVVAQPLFLAKAAGILSPLLWTLFTLGAMLIVFFLYIQKFGWGWASYLAIAIALGAAFGILVGGAK